METTAQLYRGYCRIAAGVFVHITLYTVASKIVQGRLADDWLHSVLHLASACLGALAGWYPVNVLPAKLFTLGIGLVYGALGVYGWLTSGLFLGTRFAIPLGPAENIFHLVLSLPALGIMGRDISARARAMAPAGRSS